VIPFFQNSRLTTHFIMLKKLLHTCFSVILVLLMVGKNSAQNTYGASAYFNFTYASLTANEWVPFTGAASFKAKANGNGDSLTFLNCNTLGATRAKGGYTGAVRAQSIELPAFPSLGYLSFYLQNGSSGTTRNLLIKIWDEGTSAWVTVETIAVGGNVDQRFVINSVLSKKAVKVRIDSEGQYFWFHQIEAWSSKLATSDPNEAPNIVSINPAPGATVSSTGSVSVMFDEIIKKGTGTVSFSGSTVTPVFMGNTLQVNYAGLVSSSNVLTIPATYVSNKGNVNMPKDTSIAYANDVTPPSFVSVAPVTGSNIHINDIAGKIVLTFTEDIVLSTGTINFGSATVTPVVSGKTLTLGYSGLAYSTPYTLTVPASMIKDISGNVLAADVVLQYTTNDRDATVPTLVSQSILGGATTVPIGGSIYLTFSEIMAIKGTVTLNANPVTVSLNGAMAGINFTNLEYATEYTVNIPAGALTDTTGNEYAGTSFKFTTKAFETKAFTIVVAKDGSGDFTTVQAAINQVPDNSGTRTLVYIKNGEYVEKVTIPASKVKLSLIGQDSAKTIISYNDYAGGAGGTDNSYTFDVKAADFYAENITIKNTWSATGGSTNQAVALMTEGDRQVFKNCRAFSFQDTHYPKTANTRNYYLNCFIQGATDFIFGSGTAFFESSTINCVLGGQYTTAPSGTTKEFGLVFNNSALTRNSNVPNQQYYLGRPWKDNGKTVWINTKMGPHVRDIGWAVWATAGDDADNHLTGFYAEYNTMDLAGAPINPTRAAWGKKLKPSEASRYTIDNVFNYGVGSNTWNPLPFSTAPDAPVSLQESGSEITWAPVKYAVAYVVFKNDSVMGTTINPNYIVGTFNPAATYSVKSVNEYGAQSTTAAILTSVASDLMNNKNNMVFPNPFANEISIKNSESFSAVQFFNMQGQLVKQTNVAPVVSTEDLNAGIYSVKIIDLSGKSFNVKMLKR
jgi:pectin methylesterase-like acyl-CoA thioesterase